MTKQEMAERHTSLTRRKLELEREEAAVLRELAELETALKLPPVEENTKIPEMVPIREAAGRTGLSYYYLRKLCLRGKIAYVRAGSKYLINMGRLADFLNHGMEPGT